MTRSIWKFPLSVADWQEFSMPVGAKIRCVQTQYGEPCLWAEVDTEGVSTIRKFRTIGTGHPFGEGDLIYLGTYQLQDGALVFHVYEEKVTR